MYKLSILIPSLINRKEFLIRLLNILKPQLTSEIEVIIEIDNGDMSIGAKRNLLVSKATGKYLVFIDDDDRISNDYISEIMQGIEKDVDIISIKQVITTDGKNPKLVIHIPYQEWKTLPNSYLRGIQHLDAIKSSIAKQFLYTDKSFGEDRDWSESITASKLIKTSHQVMKPIYFYEYRSFKRPKS